MSAVVPFVEGARTLASNPLVQEAIMQAGAYGVSKLGQHLGKRLKRRAAKKKKAFKFQRDRAAAIVAPDRQNARTVGSKRPKRKHKKESLKTLRKSVRKIQKKLSGDEASLYLPQFASGQITSAANQVSFNEIAISTPPNIEGILATMPYVNTATPGTNAAFDARAINQPNNWNIKLRGNLKLRNNWYMPINGKCYLVTPKIATSVAPGTALGYVSKQQYSGGTAPAATDLGLYPWDVPDFMDTYKIMETKAFYLNAGDLFEINFYKDIKYDQEMLDNHANTYLPGFSYFYIIRLEGVVCHDSTTTTNVGISSTKCDWVTTRTLKVTFPSLAPATYRGISNSLSAITVSAVTGESADLETQ